MRLRAFRPSMAVRPGRLAFVGILGLALSGTSRAEDWALPDSRLGVRTAPLLLLSRPDVREDLGLDAERSAEASRLIVELHARAASLRGRATPEVLEGRRAIDDAQRRWIEGRLSPEQRARLEQIDLQWEGPSCLLSRSRIGDSLGLTDEQRAAIDRARAEQPDPRAFAERALAHLSEDQRLRWRAMLGPPLSLRPVPGPAPAATAVRPAAPVPR